MLQFILTCTFVLPKSRKKICIQSAKFLSMATTPRVSDSNFRGRGRERKFHVRTFLRKRVFSAPFQPSSQPLKPAETRRKNKNNKARIENETETARVGLRKRASERLPCYSRMKLFARPLNWSARKRNASFVRPRRVTRRRRRRGDCNVYLHSAPSKCRQSREIDITGSRV